MRKKCVICLYLAAMLMASFAFTVRADYDSEVSRLAQEIKEEVLGNESFTGQIEKSIADIIESFKEEKGGIESIVDEILGNIFDKEPNIENIEANPESYINSEVYRTRQAIFDIFESEVDGLLSGSVKDTTISLIEYKIREKFQIPQGETGRQVQGPTDYEVIWEKIVKEKQRSGGEGETSAYIYSYDNEEIADLAEEIYKKMKTDIANCLQKEMNRQLGILGEDLKSMVKDQILQEIEKRKPESSSPSESTVPPSESTTPPTESTVPPTTSPPDGKSDIFAVFRWILPIAVFLVIGAAVGFFYGRRRSRAPAVPIKPVRDLGVDEVQFFPQAHLDREFRELKQVDDMMLTLQEKYKELNRNLGTVRSHSDNLEKDVETVKTSYKQIQEIFDQLNSAIPVLQNQYRDLARKYDSLQKTSGDFTEILSRLNNNIRAVQEQFTALKNLDYDILVVRGEEIQKAQNVVELLATFQKGVGAGFRDAEVYLSTVEKKETALKQLENDIEKTKPMRNPVLQEYWLQLLIYLDNLGPEAYFDFRTREKARDVSFVLIWDTAILSVTHALERMFRDSDTLSSMKAAYSMAAEIPGSSIYQQIRERAINMTWDEANPLVERIFEIGGSGDFRFVGFFKIFADEIYQLLQSAPSDDERRDVLLTFLKICGVAFDDMLRRYSTIIKTMRDATIHR